MADPGSYEVSELLDGEEKGPRDGTDITFSPRTLKASYKTLRTLVQGQIH